MSDRNDKERETDGLGLGLGRASQLLERVGRLAQQARRIAEELAERLLPGVGSVPAPERVPKPEPVDDSETVPVVESPATAVSVSAPEPAPDPLPTPTASEEARVVLLARDPEWFFCYWDLELSPRPPRSRLTLRLQDVTDVEFNGTNGWSQHLYPLTDDARWWHVPVPRRGRHYLAEVGYCSPEGTFSPRGRSLGVAALTAEPAAAHAVELATVDVDAPPQQPPEPTVRRSQRGGADLALPLGPVARGPVHRPAAGPPARAPAVDAARGYPGSSALWSRQR